MENKSKVAAHHDESEACLAYSLLLSIGIDKVHHVYMLTSIHYPPSPPPPPPSAFPPLSLLQCVCVFVLFT